MLEVCYIGGRSKSKRLPVGASLFRFSSARRTPPKNVGLTWNTKRQAFRCPVCRLDVATADLSKFCQF